MGFACFRSLPRPELVKHFIWESNESWNNLHRESRNISISAFHFLSNTVVFQRRFGTRCWKDKKCHPSFRFHKYIFSTKGNVPRHILWKIDVPPVPQGNSRCPFFYGQRNPLFNPVIPNEYRPWGSFSCVNWHSLSVTLGNLLIGNCFYPFDLAFSLPLRLPHFLGPHLRRRHLS